jgi:rhodanese-related sulfurtransferase
MKKLFPFILLTIVSLVVLGVVIKQDHDEGSKYALTETEYEILEKVIDRQQFMKPEELAGLIMSEKPYFVIDIRNPLNFRKGKIHEAINIPFQQIIDEKWKAFFSDSSTIKILYCNMDIYANEAWMLLDQLGYRNIKVLEGGYDFWKENVEKNYKVKSGGAYDEIPVYNYKEEMLKAGDGKAFEKKDDLPAVQINIKKKDGPKGGCN